jgi:His/Glu/Gln/Arg/opine family amino acid ABC transporter permease subunit
MTAIQRPNITNEAYYDEPPVKAPPMLVTGPLAWMRENLFGSPLDTVLTIVGTIIVIGTVTSFIQWSISAANWFAVTFNLRLFMVGRVEPFMEGRLTVLTLFIAFIVGINLAAWARVNRSVWVTLIVGVALLFVLPPVIYALVPVPVTYLAAGEAEIVSGSITEVPQPQVGFIARGGETISIRMAATAAENDRTLAAIHSFTDRAVDAVRNAANNRLEAQARIVELESLLAGDTLTARQRERLEGELAGIDVPPVVAETLAVNQVAVDVRVLDGETRDLLAEAVLTADSEPLTVEIPADGWYILEKSTVEATDSVGILVITGIYPNLERNFVRTVTTEAGATNAQRIFQYIRATDNWLTEAARPRIDGEDITMVALIDNQYKGSRDFNDYLRLMLAPFLAQLSQPLALFLALTLIGYYGAVAWNRARSPREKPRAAAQRIATWLWAALPVVTFILVAGIGSSGPLRASDPQLWGGFLLTMLLTAVGIVGAFPIGIALALGRRSSLPVVSAVCTFYIEVVRGVPLITVLFMSMLLVPFVAPNLGGPDSAPYRAMVAVTLFSAAYLAENVRGGLQSLPPGQEEAAKALGLSGWQVMFYITLPQALRAVIPALVGQFISLYKDTSLVAIVGLIDLTGVTRSVAAQTEFQGLLRETYMFISIIYFVFSYVMSIVSRRIEASGSGAARQI